MTMMPVNAGLYSYTQDVPTDITINTTDAVLLQIARQNVEDIIAWLMGQSIPFKLRFSQADSGDSPDELSFAGKMPELTARQRAKATVFEAIEMVYKKYIENVYIATPSLSVVAGEAGVCAHTFKVNFRVLYKKSFIQAHLEKKMEHAAGLLREGHACNQVAQMIGYGEKSAIKFNKMFQRHYGITPKKYQMVNGWGRAKRRKMHRADSL